MRRAPHAPKPPAFATAMGWLFLMHPRIGLVNAFLREAFDLAEAPFNIASIVGMGWVQGLNLAPLAFIMTAAVFRAMDPSLEEAALMHGAGPFTVLRRITVRLAWPGIMAAAIYIFMTAFAAFDVPAIIGWGNRIFTFTTFSTCCSIRRTCCRNMDWRRHSPQSPWRSQH